MKARTNRILTTFLTLMGVVLPSIGQASFERGGVIGVGSRAMGMGGAYGAIAEGVDTLYWNPAGLAGIPGIELTGMAGSYLNDKTRNGWIAFHVPTRDEIHLAFGLSHILFTEMGGAREDRLSMGVGLPLMTDRRFMAGLEVHYLLSELKVAGGQARGVGIDLGLWYRHPLSKGRQIRLGLLVADPSTSLRFNSGVEQKVARYIEPSVSYDFTTQTTLSISVPFTEETSSPVREGVRFRAGLEHWFFDRRLGFRAGYSGYTSLPGTISFGSSYRMTTWSVDYAFMNHPDSLGNSHRISATYRLQPSSETGNDRIKPYRLEAWVGDGRIQLNWKMPDGVRVDGYRVYFREEGQSQFQRAQQELLTTESCLLRGARNGAWYKLAVTAVIDGRETARSSVLTVTPRPMSAEAQQFFETALQQFNRGKLTAALYSARRAEQLDPNNSEIRDLIRRLLDANQKGLIRSGGKP